MTTVQDVLDGDLEAAVRRIEGAEDPDELRRALRDILANLHSWREHVRRGRNLAADGDGGRVLEALISWRVVDSHYVADLLALEHHHVVPMETLAPGEHLILGRQACFRVLADDEIDKLAQKRWRDAYPILNGQPVAHLVRTAAMYLRQIG